MARGPASRRLRPMDNPGHTGSQLRDECAVDAAVPGAAEASTPVNARIKRALTLRTVENSPIAIIDGQPTIPNKETPAANAVADCTLPHQARREPSDEFTLSPPTPCPSAEPASRIRTPDPASSFSPSDVGQLFGAAKPRKASGTRPVWSPSGAPQMQPLAQDDRKRHLGGLNVLDLRARKRLMKYRMQCCRPSRILHSKTSWSSLAGQRTWKP